MEMGEIQASNSWDLLPEPKNLAQTILQLLASPKIRNKGLSDDQSNIPIGFKDQNDIIMLLGKNRFEIAGSQYLTLVHHLETGTLPKLDEALDQKVQQVLEKGSEKGLIKSAHHCDLGGLGIALAECCLLGNMGADIQLIKNGRKDFALFGENPSRVVITVSESNLSQLMTVLFQVNVSFIPLGRVTGDALEIKFINAGCASGHAVDPFKIPVTEMKSKLQGAKE